jgi:hypothetical protein
MVYYGNMLCTSNWSIGAIMNEQEIFQYLDALRESGVTNMYGASPYLQDRFDLSKREAREFLMKWMEQFKI